MAGLPWRVGPGGRGMRGASTFLQVVAFRLFKPGPSPAIPREGDRPPMHSLEFNRSRNAGVLFCLVLAAHWATGCATSGGGKGRAGFDRIDRDRDGAISEAEFAGHVIGESFALLDANADQAIQLAEWQARETEAGAVALFETLDLNRDGQLAHEEFDSSDRKRRALERMFHTLDRSGDGLLEWEELRGR